MGTVNATRSELPFFQSELMCEMCARPQQVRPLVLLTERKSMKRYIVCTDCATEVNRA